MNWIFMSGFSIIWFAALIIVIGIVFRWIHRTYDADERKQKRWEDRDDSIAVARITKEMATSKLDIMERVLHLSAFYNVKPDILLNELRPQSVQIDSQQQYQQLKTIEIPSTRELVRR